MLQYSRTVAFNPLHFPPWVPCNKKKLTCGSEIATTLFWDLRYLICSQTLPRISGESPQLSICVHDFVDICSLTITKKYTIERYILHIPSHLTMSSPSLRSLTQLSGERKVFHALRPKTAGIPDLEYNKVFKIILVDKVVHINYSTKLPYSSG